LVFASRACASAPEAVARRQALCAYKFAGAAGDDFDDPALFAPLAPLSAAGGPRPKKNKNKKKRRK